MTEATAKDRTFAVAPEVGAMRSLADRLQQFDSPAQMLQTNPGFKLHFGYPTQYTNWETEQNAWKDTAVLFDQSIHMEEAEFSGPDVKRLFNDYGVNNFANFGRNRAKQFVAVTEEGKFVGDNIVFGLEDDVYNSVGSPIANAWLRYHIEKGGYDVRVSVDERTSPMPGAPRRHWRYELCGPATHEIIARAADGPLPEIKFFGVGELTIAGAPVRALNHTMSGVPGREYTGLELWGPYEHRQAVLDALMAAGQDLGLVRGGERTYTTAAWESGWIAVLVPGIYTAPELADYREWLPLGAEAFFSLEGSMYSDDVEDYYTDPWDLGYGHIIKFDHDFLGRDALEARAKQPKRHKVWLEWNVDDAADLLKDALFGEGLRPRMIDIPNTAQAAWQYDIVRAGDRQVGMSTWGGYTTNMRRLVTLSVLDEDVADGSEVTVTWGQDPRAPVKPLLLPHSQREVRATVRYRSLA